MASPTQSMLVFWSLMRSADLRMGGSGRPHRASDKGEERCDRIAGQQIYDVVIIQVGSRVPGPWTVGGPAERMPIQDCPWPGPRGRSRQSWRRCKAEKRWSRKPPDPGPKGAWADCWRSWPTRHAAPSPVSCLVLEPPMIMSKMMSGTFSALGGAAAAEGLTAASDESVHLAMSGQWRCLTDSTWKLQVVRPWHEVLHPDKATRRTLTTSLDSP